MTTITPEVTWAAFDGMNALIQRITAEVEHRLQLPLACVDVKLETKRARSEWTVIVTWYDHAGEFQVRVGKDYALSAAVHSCIEKVPKQLDVALILGIEAEQLAATE